LPLGRTDAALAASARTPPVEIHRKLAILVASLKACKMSSVAADTEEYLQRKLPTLKTGEASVVTADARSSLQKIYERGKLLDLPRRRARCLGCG
jgi:hypothetical protein